MALMNEHEYKVKLIIVLLFVCKLQVLRLSLSVGEILCLGLVTRQRAIIEGCPLSIKSVVRSLVPPVLLEP